MVSVFAKEMVWSVSRYSSVVRVRLRLDSVEDLAVLAPDRPVSCKSTSINRRILENLRPCDTMLLSDETIEKSERNAPCRFADESFDRTKLGNTRLLS